MEVNTKRIMCIVPNGATTDNRVVREAESLKKAGHEVLLVGLKLSNVPGSTAYTPGGVFVKRIDWRYDAYLKVALTYAVLALPIVAITGIIISYAVLWFYTAIILPLILVAFDNLGYLFLLIGDSVGLVPPADASNSQVKTDSVSGAAFRLLTNEPVLFHLLSVGFLMIVGVVAAKVLNIRGVINSILILVTDLLKPISRRFQVAKSYSAGESLEANFLNRLISSNNSFLRSVHDFVAQRHITKARMRGFVAVGLEFQPDIIQCHEIGCLMAATKLKKQIGCKVIYEAHEIYDDLANASTSLSAQYKRIHAQHLGSVDAFVTVNKHIGQYYSRHYPGLPEPVILPNSVYPKNFEYDGRLHEAAKLPSDAKILLYQGGFSPNRGLEILVEAAYELPEDWYVVLMGKGSLESDLQELSHYHFLKMKTKWRRKKLLEYRSLSAEKQDRLMVASPRVVGDNEDFPSETSIESHLLSKVQSFDELNSIVSDIIQLRDIEWEVEAEASVSKEFANIEISGIFNKVRFVPMAPHSELIEWTCGASIGVIPYENVGLNHWYCSPNKIWEYPNAGVPILSSRLSFLTYMLEKWSIGWTISSDPKAQDIVSAIRNIDNRELAEKVKNCKRFISKDNYLVHETRLLNLVEELGS